MENVFANEKKHAIFAWENLGNVKEGRKALGEEMPVVIYRLMQYTMLDVLTKDMGVDGANTYFRKAGHLAGTEYAKNVLDLSVDFDSFFAQFQKSLRELKIGILRIEAFDLETGELELTMGEDLDCSGLPVTYENVCVYDEGFISGVLETYTGKKYNVQEVDCWAMGGRDCRFHGKIEE